MKRGPSALTRSTLSKGSSEWGPGVGDIGGEVSTTGFEVVYGWLRGGTS